MQQIIRANDLVASPWKNGGGVTREIASVAKNGALHWRLSIADVEKDGPFSLFPGLARILTVIDGPGMDLYTSDGVLQADPLRPLGFAGDVTVHGRLRSGPVRNFNLIYDPEHVTPSVTVLTTPQELPNKQLALHSLRGTAKVAGATFRSGDTVLTTGGGLHISGQAQILCVTF